MTSREEYSNALTVDIAEIGGAIVMYLVGECDIGTASLLTEEFHRALSESKDVVLDVHLLTYIDSIGISAVASAHKSLTMASRQLRVAGSHGLFDRIMRITHLDRVIQTYDSVDAALAAIDGI